MAASAVSARAGAIGSAWVADGSGRLQRQRCASRILCRSTQARSTQPIGGGTLRDEGVADDMEATSARKGPVSRGEGGWSPLDSLVWQGTESDAMARGTDPIRHASWASVSPPWKVMLLSDGSVTRHLSLLTDLDVDVDCREMRNIGQDREGLPSGAELLEGPLVQRQVFLRGHNRQAHVYAASWWNAEEVDTYLSDTKKPIWVSLSEGRTELYREIRSLYYGHSEELEREFGCQGPFWGRHYIFWHNGKPLTLIYEVFSLSLEMFLGPCSLVTADEDPESSVDLYEAQ